MRLQLRMRGPLHKVRELFSKLQIVAEYAATGMTPLDTEAVTQSRAIRMLNTLFATAEHECPSTSILDDLSSCVNQAMAGPSNFTTDVGCHEKEQESDDSGASFVTAANSVSSSAGH
jgi:hypothetical protein